MRSPQLAVVVVRNADQLPKPRRVESIVVVHDQPVPHRRRVVEPTAVRSTARGSQDGRLRSSSVGVAAPPRHRHLLDHAGVVPSGEHGDGWCLVLQRSCRRQLVGEKRTPLRYLCRRRRRLRRLRVVARRGSGSGGRRGSRASAGAAPYRGAKAAAAALPPPPAPSTPRVGAVHIEVHFRAVGQRKSRERPSSILRPARAATSTARRRG